MQEPSIRVMNMVRRTLLENPGVSDRALYAAAVALEPSIADLTLQQFGARYPHRIRRKEMGEPTPRRRMSAGNETPPFEGPRLYAPGGDTLIPEARPMLEARADPTAESEPVQPPQPAEEAEKESTPAPESDATPWPLRLHPDAADLEPPKRSRRPRRIRRRAAPQETVKPTRPAATRPAASKPAEDPRIAARSEVRRVMFSWASEIVAAESRGDFVRALARAEDYVRQIEQAFDGTGPDASRETSVAPAPVTFDSTRIAPPARPEIQRGKRISSYGEDELDGIVRWVSHARRWRNRDTLVARVASELGFQRRGKRIRETIRRSIDRVLGAEGSEEAGSGS